VWGRCPHEGGCIPLYPLFYLVFNCAQLLISKYMKKKRLKKAVILSSVSLSSILIIKVLVWDPENNRWLIQDLYYHPPTGEKLTIAPTISQVSTVRSNLIATQINDASKLNATQVSGIFQPVTTEEIKELVQFARKEGKKISLSGSRHSMGGQIVYPNSIHLDMLKFDRFQYNQDKTITVQSGAIWKQIQIELGKHDRAVRVMQDSNIFSVGGSLSVNAHGKDPRFGSLIESVNYFKLINAEGQEIICSRQENSDLFRAVIGGMGLFGIITEINLKTEANSTYEYTVVHRPGTEMIPFMEEQIKRHSLEMIEAQMSVDQSNFLSEAQIYYFNKVKNNPSLKDDVNGENSIWLRKLVYRTSRVADWGKQFRWLMQKQVGPLLDSRQITRNSGMAAPFRTLELNDSQTTDVLQEYFVPVSQTNDFLNDYKALLHKNNMQLINVTVRKVKADREALVSYATEEMYAFVSYYRITKDRSGYAQMIGFTQELMEKLNQINAKFYLAYKGYYTKEQLYQMYPNLNQLFALKRKYDPQMLFNNQWYEEFKK
jgi:FAD/FMN-containing dehydrogenase